MHQLRLVVYPIIYRFYRVLYIPGGDRRISSIHQQYYPRHSVFILNMETGRNNHADAKGPTMKLCDFGQSGPPGVTRREEFGEECCYGIGSMD